MLLLPKPLIFSRKINIFQVFAKSMFLQFSRILQSKIHPKIPPKRSPNDEKINAENVLIFNIDFLRFWPRFGRVLGLQDGAKLALKPSKNFGACPFLPS